MQKARELFKSLVEFGILTCTLLMKQLMTCNAMCHKRDEFFKFFFYSEIYSTECCRADVPGGIAIFGAA